MKKGFKADRYVWLLFLAIVIIRIVLAFQADSFTYDSYFNIKQVESILETGKPIFNDPLSFGGRFSLFSPVFHYIFAFFSLLAPLQIVAKIIPNILYALLIPISYYISLKIVPRSVPAFFSAIFAALLPGLWSTVNSFDTLCIVLPAIFYIFYCLIRVNEKKYLIQFLVLIAATSIISPITILIIPALWFFILLLKIENLEERTIAMEAIIFSSFLILLIQFLLYKKALLIHGYSIIWQNIPFPILDTFFEKITILNIIAGVGIIAFIFGIYEIYRFSFTKKERSISTIVSLTLITAALLWVKLIEINVGMIFLGVGLAIISSKTIGSIYSYFKKIKLKIHFNYVILIVISILLLTSVPPSIDVVKNSRNNIPTNAEIEGMLWLKENSGDTSTIVATPKEGFLINAVAKRKNIIDNNFIMGKNADTRYSDIKTIFTTQLETNALELLNKYRAKYIFLSENSRRQFNIQTINYCW